MYLRPFGRPIHLTTNHTTIHTHTTYVTAPAAIEPPAPDPCAFTEGEAWELIAAQRLDEALETFVCLAREYHYDGLPHVGYALANALLGADESAIAIMRHAVQIDAESLQYVPADERIDQQIVDVLGFYTELSRHPGRESDGLFMIAALRTILGDHGGAYFAITEAGRHGNADHAASALHTMLGELLMDDLSRTP